MANSLGKAADWTNDDGLVIGFGPREPANTRGGKLPGDGAVNTISVKFAYNDLPVGGNNDSGQPQIPANAVILDGYVYVTTAFADTTGLTIGLTNLAGTAIDADGLLTTKAAAALTDETKVALDGALVGTTIGAAAGFLVAADASGNSTAGVAELVVNYYVPTR
jgi:hypothetical protein